jgi:hypothetical protein
VTLLILVGLSLRPRAPCAVSKNHLELRSNSPQWVYSTAPLVKPDGTPVDHPQAGAAGYAMSLNDRQVQFVGLGRLGVWVQGLGSGLGLAFGFRVIGKVWGLVLGPGAAGYALPFIDR